jgi:hypothetical protein
MIKFLSNCLLILNPIIGFFVFYFLIIGNIILIPLLVISIVFILKLHYYAYKKEHKEYEIWREEFSKEYEYLGEYC